MRNLSRRAACLAAFAAALFACPMLASAQSVGYSLLPSYEEMRWDDAFGLEDSRLYGIRAAFDFGPYFSLQPFYEWNDEVGLRDDYSPPADVEVAEEYDVSLYGAEMQVNLGRGSLVPFLKGGGGILRIDDDVVGRRDRIVLRGGAGVRFAFGDRSGAELFAERVSTRLSEPFVPGAVGDDELEDDDVASSLLLGAGLRLAIGGGAPGGGSVDGLVPGLYLEPYASRIDFADEMLMPRQYTLGARGGIDFNQNVGLRAYYWRGVDDGFDDWMDIEGFGGEAQFALNSGPGLSPFLLVGAGRITPMGDYRDENDAARSRFDHLTLGGGVSWALGERTNLELAVRDLLTSVTRDIEDVQDPDALVSNWQYSAGLSVALGASPDRGTRTSDADANERERLERELAELREQNRRLAAGEDPAAVRADTLDVPRTITVPVPEVGEIILRYGEAYAAAGAVAPGDTTQPMAARMQAMMDSMQARDARMAEAVREAVRAELEARGIAPGEPVTTADPTPDAPFYEDLALGALLPYGGVELDPDGADRILLGLQADMGIVSDALPIHIIPDVSFGLGGGSATLMVGVNGRFSWDVGTDYDLAPFVEAGLAVSDRRLLNANLGYGAEFNLGSGPDPMRLFIQHRGVQAFDEHQFLVGIRLPR